MLLRKEFMKIGVCAVAGLIIGLIMALGDYGWGMLLMAPLYVIGIVYAFQYVVRSLTAIFRWFAGLMGISVGSFNCCGIICGILILAALISVVLGVVWIIGLFLALRSLFVAYQQEGIVRNGSHPALPEKKDPFFDDENGFDMDDDPFSSDQGSGDYGSDDDWDL